MVKIFKRGVISFFIIMISVHCAYSQQVSIKEKLKDIKTYPRLLPVPQKVNLGRKLHPIKKNWVVRGSGISKDEPAVISLKDGLLKRYQYQLNETFDKNQNNAAGSILLVIRPGAVVIGKTTDTNITSIARQAYRISLNENTITVTANASAGLYYGVQTLLQLLQHSNDQIIYVGGEIVDWPDMNLRMIYWDDAHHLEKLAVLKREIRQASYYKINGFALKLEGHFQYRTAKPIVEPYALSAKEYQELTDYAAAHFVQLVPFLDAPAHVSFILKHPEYAHLRAFPNSNYQFTVNNPQTYELLLGMFDELINANKGVEYILLSNDEAYYTGKAINEIDSAKALGGNGKLLAQFITRMANELKKRGRKVIFWGEYPLVPDDIKKLPAHLINGVYNTEWASVFKEQGIRQLIYTSTQGEEPLFPNYYPLAADKVLHAENGKLRPRVGGLLETINTAVAEKKADLMGVIVAGWADAGLHPQTFWLGYVTGTAAGWNNRNMTAEEMSSRFFTSFYRSGNVDMERVYELLSKQAQFYEDSWEWEPSNSRLPIFGNDEEIYDVQRPALDQTLPMLPVVGNKLILQSNWTDSNSKRLHMAELFLKDNYELMNLLRLNLHNVADNRYNVEVMISVAKLCRQSLEMLFQLRDINKLVQDASSVGSAKPGVAVSHIDKSLQLAETIRRERNEVFKETVAVWYEDWLPVGVEANGRRYLHRVDDVKDHRPVRTADMSYLMYRQLRYPLGKWTQQILKARNAFAGQYKLSPLKYELNWEKIN